MVSARSRNIAQPGFHLRAIVGAIAITAFLNVARAAADQPPLRPLLSPCAIPGLALPARCGVIDVPENPGSPQGRLIPVAIMVVPALRQPALPDPIVPLMGGPGEDAISAAADFAEQFAELRSERDLLFVDQRGTGRSAALRCALHSDDAPEATLRDFFPPAAVRRCRTYLRGRADLTQYTYAHFANDLEHVRGALGYGPMNLFAGSYGTRAAQVYLRAYPQSARTLYLGSVVPIDLAMPLPLARAAQDALEKTIQACAADSACNAAFPNVRAEFDEILARLDSGDVRVSLPGRARPLRLHRGRVGEWFRAKLYRAATAADVPWLIHRAWLGDWRPIAAGILSDAARRDGAASLGLFFAITCNEDVAFVREPDIALATRGSFIGEYRVRQQIAACRGWPKARLPSDYRTPARPTTPALFVSGDSDPASPLSFTQRASPNFSNRAELVLRGRGHTEWSECVGRLYAQFGRAGDARGLDVSACETAPRPPFKTT